MHGTDQFGESRFGGHGDLAPKSGARKGGERGPVTIAAVGALSCVACFQNPLRNHKRLPGSMLALILVCSFSFGAIVKLALANDYHVNCVGHGFLHGASQTDGSFFSRVEGGCGSSSRRCDIFVWGHYVGGLTVGAATCNAWSRDWGDYTECAATAHTAFPAYFGDHVHKASNWCR